MKLTERVASLIVLALAGCASAPPPAPAVGTGNWIPPGGRISIAVGRFDPPVSVDGESWAVQRAGRGALQGVALCLQGTGGANVGRDGLAALALICAPFGAVYGVASLLDSAFTTKATIARATRALYLSPMLAAQVERYLHEQGMATDAMLREQGPSSPADAPRYVTGDYVVEISITSVVATAASEKELPYRFVVGATGRLLRVSDNAVLDTASTRAATSFRTANDWARNQGVALSSELEVVMEHIAREFLDEWVFIYRGQPLTRHSAASTQSLSPDYVLRSIEPSTRMSTRSARTGLVSQLMPASVADLTPILAWEPLPRTMSPELFAGTPPRARALRYEVRIFEGGWFTSPTLRPAVTRDGPRLSVPVFRAARQIGVYKELEEPRLQLKDPLRQCRHYFWTVRASFDLDGRRRVTEWSGAYVAAGQESDPRALRSSTSLVFTPSSMEASGAIPQSGYFLAFKTPMPDGRHYCGSSIY